MVERQKITGFKYPPVVEAWIEFKLYLSDENTTWEKSGAKDFIEKYFGDFKVTKFLEFARIAIDVKTGRPDFSKAEELFDRIRAFTEEGDRCIQAGRNILVYNQLKRNDWPRYEKMRDGAFSALEKYMEFRGLSKIENVSLHYRDIVPILPDKGGVLRLEDYFKVCLKVPEDVFGNMSGFRFEVQLPQICENANAILNMQNLPPVGQSEGKFQFAMDWHITSINIIGKIDMAKEWLEVAHKVLWNSFLSAFTEKGLALFEPEGGV